MKMGTRNIQVATSKDLLKWDEFQSIEIDFNPETDNYYYPSFFMARGKFYGFLPFYQPGKATIRICQSSDGITWQVLEEWLTGHPVYHGDNLKNFYHSVNGIINGKEFIYIYVQHNYMGINPDVPVYLKRYGIKKNEF